MLPKLTEKGEKYRDFLLVKHLPIKELNATLRELIHVPSGAQVMQIECDDPENLFCLSFKTLPSSSNGAPHILEHTVLCGSRRFPVKDPFFAMNRRSLNTFMNALTGSDFTCYPAASQVEKDFYNLLEVYLDAVFHPLLKEESFLQEGHRLEFTKPKDPATALEIKGIVYNEMKGSMASIDSLIWHTVMAKLVPDLPYAYNSGGDPEEIPSLTYPQLIDFHETYYHPSRCLFFFYGNMPLTKHLDFIEQHTLKQAKGQPPLPEIPKQKRFKAAQTMHFAYPLQEDQVSENEHIYCLSFLTTPLSNQDEMLALAVLDAVLMDTDASPLKKVLLDSGLCVQADSYIDTEMSEIPFVFICRGCQADAGPKIEALFRSTLEKIENEGIAFDKIEAVIHQIELARTEIGGNHNPFGLTLFMRAALAKQHGYAPEQALLVHSLFADLLHKAQNPHFLSPLIRKYFLENTHQLTLNFAPDPTFTDKQIQAEKKKLKELKKSLNEKQIAKILEQSKHLADYQKQLEGQKIECLPKVTLADVPEKARNFPLETQKWGNLEVFKHQTFTNHIVYADLFFDLPALSEEELFYLQLFATLWTELGSGGRSYSENLAYMQANTGGIGASLSLHVQAKDSQKCRPALQLRGKALQRKIPQLFNLMRETVVSPRFDEKKRMEELLRKMASQLKNRLSRQAMRYATQLATSSLSIPSHISEIWHGLSYYEKIQTLAANLPKELPSILEALSQKILKPQHPHLVLSGDETLFQELEKQAFFGLTQLPTEKQLPWTNDYPPSPIPSQARIISSPVAFTAWAMPTIPYHHPDAPALLISTLLMENKILHHRIREQGGAYGAGATYNPMWGNFTFYAYRDPHLAHTLHTFQHAIDEIATGQFEKNDLEEAKLGIIQQMDQPTAPGSRGLEAYIWQRDGKSTPMRQEFRENLLKLNQRDLAKAVEKHLKTAMDQAITVSLAGNDLIERENLILKEEGKALQVIPLEGI